MTPIFTLVYFFLSFSLFLLVNMAFFPGVVVLGGDECHLLSVSATAGCCNFLVAEKLLGQLFLISTYCTYCSSNSPLFINTYMTLQEETVATGWLSVLLPAATSTHIK